MNVLVTLTSAGTDTGPFYLYSNYDNYMVPIDSGISRASLMAGYVCTTVPSGATYIRVESTGDCTNHVDIAISFPTTTTTTSTSTSTTTTTTTVAPPITTTTTTSTTTAAPVTTTTTTTSGGGTTTTTTTAGGGTTTTTTTSGGGGTTTTTTTPAPGTTTTTTTAQPVYHPLLAYSAVDGATACSNYNSYINMGTYDTHCSPITTGCYLYTNGHIGDPAFYVTDGWYSNGSTYWYFQNGNTGDAGTSCGGGTTTTTTSTTTASPTTTTTTTANVLCDQGNIVIIAMDGVYGPYSYRVCSTNTLVSQPGGTGTVGQILETGVCVKSGTFSNTGGTVQLNPTGSCA